MLPVLTLCDHHSIAQYRSYPSWGKFLHRCNKLHLLVRCIACCLKEIVVQALHRNHAAPSGCYITGDPSIGYTLHFRATDASAAEVNKMRRFRDLCNAGASVIARGAQAVTLLAQPQAPPQPAARESLLPTVCLCHGCLNLCAGTSTCGDAHKCRHKLCFSTLYAHLHLANMGVSITLRHADLQCVLSIDQLLLLLC